MPGGIHPPIEVMLAWPKPNYVNSTTRPNTVLVLACICGPLTTFLVLARLWVRVYHQQNAGLDDWIMAVAFLPLIALTAIIPLTTEVYFFNRHAWDIEPKYYVIQRKYVLVIETVFCVATGLIKISILLFYRRLSSRAVSAAFRWTTWVTIGFIAAYSIAFTLAPIFGCSPMSAFWDQLNYAKIAQGYKYKCFNEGADVFAAGVISAFQDLLTAILPTFLYWNLQIPLRQKIALFSIFAIGYGVVAVGALRAYYGYIIFFKTYDVTWATWESFLWTLIELHIGAICANAPAMKVFFRHFLRIERLSSNKSSLRSKSSNSSPSYQTSSTSTFEKFIFRNSKHARSKYGYFSEPHSEVSVDSHGVVRLQRDIHVTQSSGSAAEAKRSSADTTDILCGRYYDDIEMGSFDTEANTRDFSLQSSWEDDVQALPPIPPSQKRAATNNITLRPPRPALTEKTLTTYPFSMKSKTKSGQRTSS